jgi:hypothetical protein
MHAVRSAEASGPEKRAGPISLSAFLALSCVGMEWAKVFVDPVADLFESLALVFR